jgi:hypothetical protein
MDKRIIWLIALPITLLASCGDNSGSASSNTNVSTGTKDTGTSVSSSSSNSDASVSSFSSASSKSDSSSSSSSSSASSSSSSSSESSASTSSSSSFAGSSLVFYLDSYNSELDGIVWKMTGDDEYIRTIQNYQLTFTHCNVGGVRYYKKVDSVYEKTATTETYKCISLVGEYAKISINPQFNPLKALDLYMLDTSLNGQYRPAPYLKYWCEDNSSGTIQATTNERSSSTTVIKGQEVRVIHVSFSNITMPAGARLCSLCNESCMNVETSEIVENSYGVPCDMYMMTFNDI